MDLTHTRTPSYSDALIHLPPADACAVDAVLDELIRMADAVPTASVGASIHDEERAMDAPSHGEAFVLLVPLVETLLELEPDELTAPMHAQLAMFGVLPSIPEAMVLQIAFGRKVGEQHTMKIARLMTRARRRGLSVDEYVAELSAAGAIPRDNLVRLFLGEARRSPSIDRIRRGIALLRTTASVVPEPFRPPLLCAIAWLLWSRGSRPVALAYLAEASRIEPGHVLAYGLSVLISSTMPAWHDDTERASP